tara:strand:- start:24 stop:158 length:135 start_codon:yes stop_codon:yes gene_type:complete
LIKEAEAELSQSANLENERKFKEKIVLARGMMDTARTSRVVVAG